MDSKELREMIKSWWAEKSHRKNRSLRHWRFSRSAFFVAWGDKTDRYLHCRASVPRAKIKKDIKWMQDQASTHGLLGHLRLRSPSKISFSRKQNVRIYYHAGKRSGQYSDNSSCHSSLENVSRWLTTAQITHGIVIEIFSLLLPETKRSPSSICPSGATIMAMLLPLFILVGFIAGILLMPWPITSRLWRIKRR